MQSRLYQSLFAVQNRIHTASGDILGHQNFRKLNRFDGDFYEYLSYLVGWQIIVNPQSYDRWHWWNASAAHGKNTFCTWDEMQRNHVLFWILLFNTIEGHPANQLRYEVYNEYMKYKSVLNVLDISIRVGFCPSTVSRGFQQCISPRFVQIPIKNCSQIVIFSYIFETKKTTGGAGSCDFFWGSPSRQDSFKRYMGFHGLQRWMNPNGPLDEFRFFLSTNVGGRYGDGIWTSKDGHIPLHFHHRWGFVFVSSSPRSKVFWGRFGLWEWLVTS